MFQQQLLLMKNVTAEIKGIFDNESIIKCKNLNGDSWSSDSCNIEEVNKYYAILSFERFSTFRT